MAEIRAQVLSNRRGGNTRFDLDSDVDYTLAEDRRALGRVMRRAIRQSPYWPVRTGASRSAFRVSVLKSGIRIFNRYRYAYIVEATYTRPRYPITETISEAIEQEARARPGGLGRQIGRSFTRGFRTGSGLGGF